MIKILVFIFDCRWNKEGEIYNSFSCHVGVGLQMSSSQVRIEMAASHTQNQLCSQNWLQSLHTKVFFTFFNFHQKAAVVSKDKQINVLTLLTLNKKLLIVFHSQVN